MLKSHRRLLLLILTISFYTSRAQYIDSVNVAAKAAYHDLPAINNATEIKFSYKSFIVPVMMLGYGFSTIYNEELKDLNEEVKEEVWTENPHKKIHIDNYLQYVPAFAVYGFNIAGIKGRNNLVDRSMIYLISNVFMNTAVFSIKSITKQQRPDGSSYKSFPSGHTAEAFASAEFLRQEYKELSCWYGVGGYVAATATGLLRMYNNKHWLSDIVAGAGIGIASTKLAYLVYPVIKRKFFKKQNLNTMIMPYYQSKGAGLSMIYNFKQ